LCKTKKTECVEPSGYTTTKNGRLMHFCTCAECGIKKSKFVPKKSGQGIYEVIMAIPKVAWKATKKLEDVAKWNAERTHKKPERQIKEGKRKKYAGESWFGIG